MLVFVQIGNGKNRKDGQDSIPLAFTFFFFNSFYWHRGTLAVFIYYHTYFVIFKFEI